VLLARPERPAPFALRRFARIESRVRANLSFLRLTYAQKLSLVAAIPLILAVAAIAAIVAVQARGLAER
jgi:two-component system NarL family sensor kinase